MARDATPTRTLSYSLTYSMLLEGIESNLHRATEASLNVSIHVPAGRGGGIQGPSVKSWRSTARRFRPCLAAVWM